MVDPTFVPISQPNSMTTYGETFAQPLGALTRRLSTASSNHGSKATTAESENGTSNGRKKSKLSSKQHSPAQLKWKKPDVNKKSKLQEATRGQRRRNTR